MKLSIIIPIYNVELYLESCLLSVLNQTDINDTEIILVDDCGTDNSMDIARKFVQEYADSYNIKIVSHLHNQGLSAARNTGIKHAKGEYVFFLDSDDELPVNTIKIFNNYLIQYGNADFFIGNYIVEGPFNGSILKNTKIVYNNNDEIFNAYINNEWYVMACGKFINRLFLISNNLWFPVKRLHEDIFFSFNLALTSTKIVIIKQNVYIYKIRDNSITTNKKRKNYIDLYWIISQQIIELNKKTQFLTNTFIYNYIIVVVFNFIVALSVSNLNKKENLILQKWAKRLIPNEIKTNTNISNYIRLRIIYLPSKLSTYVCKTLNKIFKWY